MLMEENVWKQKPYNHKWKHRLQKIRESRELVWFILFFKMPQCHRDKAAALSHNAPDEYVRSPWEDYRGYKVSGPLRNFIRSTKILLGKFSKGGKGKTEQRTMAVRARGAGESHKSLWSHFLMWCPCLLIPQCWQLDPVIWKMKNNFKSFYNY